MFRRALLRWLGIGLLWSATGLAVPSQAAENPPSPPLTKGGGEAGGILVFAAASTTNVIQDLAALYEQEKGVKVATSFAAASALAKQIEQGAPADVFISADLRWMDLLESQNKIVKASRRDLLGNRLVLVAPKGKAFPVKLEKSFDLPGAFQGRWCTGDPAGTAAGIYGKQALTTLGWWAALEPRLVAAQDVRSALAFVERGECAVGIVFETDAKISDKVEVLGAFPADTHPPVLYPAALVQGAKPAAQKFLDFLRTPAAAKIFRQYGFTVLD